MKEFQKIKASKSSLRNRSLILGVGVNDAWYMVNQKIDNKMIRCPVYAKWKDMIKRSYSESLHKEQPTYSSATVCNSWLSFSCFAKWYENNYKNGYQLDKDIISKGNKTYSPELCLFVPSYINSLIINCAASRGEFKQGVSVSHGKFRATIRIDGKYTHLGAFANEDDAYLAYKLAKNSEILRKCELHPEFKVHLIKHLIA